jgi:non-ribosomal peptide synthetase component E (peptide arylation enzyme)
MSNALRPIQSDLWQLVQQRATITPDAELLVDRSGRRVTCAEFRDQAETMAAGLASLGVTEADTVAWELPTTIDAVELAVAPSVGRHPSPDHRHLSRSGGRALLPRD